MINVTVINMKSIIKYLVFILILIIGIVCTRYFFANNKKRAKIDETESIAYNNLISCIDTVLPDIKGKSSIAKLEQSQKLNKESNLKRMLNLELPMLDKLIIDGEEDGVHEIIQEEQIEKADTNVTTQEIQENNIASKYTSIYGTVKIKNESNKEITEDILMPTISLENNKDVLIFHTHTCESYTPSEKYNYEMTGSYRTTNLNFSVARVGSELEKHLKEYGYNVVHDQTYHDYPAYSGSYGRSLTTVENILKNNTNAQVVIDLHRDAVGSNSNYAPSVQIGNEVAAQMMFVIGTDGGGLWHTNWQQNLKFAVKVQEKANELYPGLFRPIIVRNSRYNQHLTKAASIIEVGATGNTMDQCLVSMKYLAKILSEVVK